MSKPLDPNPTVLYEVACLLLLKGCYNQLFKVANWCELSDQSHKMDELTSGLCPQSFFDIP